MCPASVLNTKVRKKISRTTMNSEMLSIPVLPTTGGQKSYEYRATSLWNEWELALKLSESVTSA